MSRVLRGTATPEEREQFVEHAMVLRMAVVDAVDSTDTWDQEWPELGYAPYAPDNDAVYDTLREWRQTSLRDLLDTARNTTD